MLLLTRASKRAIRSEVNAVETVKRKFTAAELQQYKKRSMFGEVWRNYKKSPSAMIGLVVLVIIIVVAIRTSFNKTSKNASRRRARNTRLERTNMGAMC